MDKFDKFKKTILDIIVNPEFTNNEKANMVEYIINKSLMYFGATTSINKRILEDPKMDEYYITEYHNRSMISKFLEDSIYLKIIETEQIEPEFNDARNEWEIRKKHKLWVLK